MPLYINERTGRPIIPSQASMEASLRLQQEAIDVAFTPSEKATIVNGLQVAARRFDEDAKTAIAAGHLRMAEQFERQAADSRAIAERLE